MKVTFTPKEEDVFRHIEVIFDNGGGVTIQDTKTKLAVYHPEGGEAAANDIMELYDGERPSEWDGASPEYYVSDEVYAEHAPNGGYIAVIGRVIGELTAYTDHDWQNIQDTAKCLKLKLLKRREV